MGNLKRKTEVMQGEKLPETLPRRLVLFSEIADDARAYCEANNQGFRFDAPRIEDLEGSGWDEC